MEKDFSDFEDKEETKAETPKKEEATLAKDEDGVPYCVDHHCRMKQYSGRKKGSTAAHYRCPVPGCECTAKLIRTQRESVVPSSPVTCPHCSSDKSPVYCKQNKDRSTAAGVVLTCPSCNWSSNMLATPELAAQHYNMRRAMQPVQGIGDR